MSDLEMRTAAPAVSKARRDQQEFDAKVGYTAASASPEARKNAAKLISWVGEPDVDTAFFDIDQEMAAIILDKHNKHNRGLGLPKAQEYADAMRRNAWKRVHQGIAFYDDRNVADGQHRLAAILLSGVTVPLNVMRNFEESAMEVIDTGKPRTAADALELQKICQPYSKLAAKISEPLMKYEELRINTRKFNPTNTQVREWVVAREAQVTEACEMTEGLKVTTALPKLVRGSAALGMLLGGYEKEFVLGYLSDIAESIGRYPDCPTSVLHDKFYRAGVDPDKTLSYDTKLALLFKGAGLFHQQLSAKRLEWRQGKEPLPAPMPPRSRK